MDCCGKDSFVHIARLYCAFFHQNQNHGHSDQYVVKVENSHSLVVHRLGQDQHRTSAVEHQLSEKVWLDTGNYIQEQKLVKWEPYYEKLGLLSADGKVREQQMEVYDLGHAWGHFYLDVLQTVFGEI